ncbi:hypothetical protein PF005_g26549 [Phytophthora fragariae]|nr:hypothetical protein PF003_g33201 [Phytophthora fragariae]KAE8918673.1 hypothetical protein PF009_g31015 [Phytophthora fragariae]KAE9064802.1 hypothetical protein PF006_g30606 [Phytophthora fragariae]KAE9074060.1 hypothetical protein PF007_g25563 [Phytophthora fragariae]KAE9163379.1 hypothetical protein PF004_g30162 [Phytophthora fragariae]
MSMPCASFLTAFGLSVTDTPHPIVDSALNVNPEFGLRSPSNHETFSKCHSLVSYKP